MAIVLYEGFNFSTTDSPKLDTNYWSSNNIANISYSTGRTDNEVIIANHSWNTETPSINTLVLSNFDDPLSSNNCFAFGCSHAEQSLLTSNPRAPSMIEPLRAKYMEFKNSANEVVLTFNLIKTTFQGNMSIGLEVVQNNNVVTVYDFSSYNGRSWTISIQTDSSGWPYPTYPSVGSRIYFECFIDAKNQNKMSVRVSQDNGTVHGYLLNSNNQEETAISGFSSLGSITWFGKHDNAGNQMRLDDFYFSKGNSASECYLGANTRIYRLSLASNGSTLQWISNNSNQQFSNLNNSDGDANYIYSSINSSGDTSIFDLNNLPVNPSNVSIIVKPINIMRKTGDANLKFTNVMTTGTGGTITNLGPEQTVSSSNYNIQSSLIAINPVTGNPWTVSDINNMQIGVKNLGGATS